MLESAEDGYDFVDFPPAQVLARRLLQRFECAAGVFDDVHRLKFFETEAGVVVAASSCFRSSQHLLHVADRQRDFDHIAGAVQAAQPDAALKGFEGVALHLGVVRVFGEKPDSGSTQVPPPLTECHVKVVDSPQR